MSRRSREYFIALASTFSIACCTAPVSMSTAGRPGSTVGGHGEAALLDLAVHPADDVAGDLAEVGRRHPVGPQAGFHPREVEDVLDQAGQLLGLVVDDPVVLGGPFRRADPAQLQGLGEQLDQRQRRLQVVRDRGDEVRLQLGQPHFAGRGAGDEEHAGGHHQRQDRHQHQLRPAARPRRSRRWCGRRSRSAASRSRARPRTARCTRAARGRRTPAGSCARRRRPRRPAAPTRRSPARPDRAA